MTTLSNPDRAGRLAAALERDGPTCVWCGRTFGPLVTPTTEHVVPRIKGGPSWAENEVAACSRCNHRKADRLLSELGWSLPFRPCAPASTVAVLFGYARRDPAWEPYLLHMPSPVRVMSQAAG